MERLSEIEDEVLKDGLTVSEEKYWAEYYQGNFEFTYEWNNGHLDIKPLSALKGNKCYQWFHFILHNYMETNPVCTIVTHNIGFRLAFPGNISVRIPDLAAVLHSNPDAIEDDDCSYKGIFDLCVESLSYASEKEIRRDTVHKKREYRGAGVKEYYILDARQIETVFYYLDKTGRRYRKIRPVKGDIIRSRVLPGFQFRISDLYRQPFLEELAEDPVYYEYVIPSYHRMKQTIKEFEQRKKAEQEIKKIERRRKKFEQETKKAEQKIEAAEHKRKKAEEIRKKAENLLRDLGISPESVLKSDSSHNDRNS